MEQEFKFQINAAEHAVIAKLFQSHFGEAQLLHQANHFFDSADGVLQAQGMAVRLRQQNDRYLLTCKWGRTTQGALATVQEFERDVPAEMAQSLLAAATSGDPMELPLAPTVLTVLQKTSSTLELRAGFTNKRLRWDVDGVEIALDHADIGGQEEFELELELQGGAISDAERLAEQVTAAGVRLVPQPKSKLERLKERRPQAFS